LSAGRLSTWVLRFDHTKYVSASHGEREMGEGEGGNRGRETEREGGSVDLWCPDMRLKNSCSQNHKTLAPTKPEPHPVTIIVKCTPLSPGAAGVAPGQQPRTTWRAGQLQHVRAAMDAHRCNAAHGAEGWRGERGERAVAARERCQHVCPRYDDKVSCNRACRGEGWGQQS
jgi:hypothetical protein